MTHIPTIATKSMDWKGLVKEIGPMAARLGKKRLDKDQFKSLSGLHIAGLDLLQEDLHNNYEELNAEEKRKAGEAVLKLYFSQLRNEDGLCLDLRPKHFDCKDNLRFSPNNVWFHFNSSFRLALIDLYRGFYHERDDLFDSALSKIGLTRGLEADQKERLNDLFRTHFGPGDQHEVVFDLEHFKDSFYELFKFFVDHEVELDKDFMFLGTYLVSLYMNLEKLSIPLDVRNVFLEVFPK